jgi:hypothetical protein
MRERDTINQDPEQAGARALQALAWIVSDGPRAQRLLALTGLDANGLRAGLADPGVQAAALAFLESHEPDLIACAEALDVAPQALVEARITLETT